jgi:serine/threonine-protein kinase
LFGSAGTARIVKLADFGNAKALMEEEQRDWPQRPDGRDGGRSVPEKRVSLYSPGWAAPEQLRDQPLSATADVFSLGLVTIYMLTGKKVFADENLHQAIEDRNAGDAFVEQALSTLPLDRGLRTALTRACRMDASERPPGSREFLDDLRGAIDKATDLSPQRKPTLRLPVTAEVESQLAGGSPLATALPRAEVSIEKGNGAQAEAVHADRAAVAQESGSPVFVSRERSEENPGSAPPVVVLTHPCPPELEAGGDRIQLLAVSDAVNVESPWSSDDAAATIRLRLTLLPESQGLTRVNLKGLNCFLAKPGDRPTRALDLREDRMLVVLSSDRKQQDMVQIRFGHPLADARLYRPGPTAIVLPAESFTKSCLLEFGQSGQRTLVYAKGAA